MLKKKHLFESQSKEITQNFLLNAHWEYLRPVMLLFWVRKHKELDKEQWNKVTNYWSKHTQIAGK